METVETVVMISVLQGGAMSWLQQSGELPGVIGRRS